MALRRARSPDRTTSSRPSAMRRGTLHGLRAYPRNCGEFRDELVVGQLAQGVLVQASVGWPPGEVAECVELPPREPGLAGACQDLRPAVRWVREMAAEQVHDAGQGPAGRRDGQLLAGDLEQQGTEQIH